MTIEDVSISIIKYIDDILLSLETCVEMFGDSSTPSALVDKMQYIEQSVKEIDKTITVLQLNLKELHSRYAGLFKDLKYNRNSLICKINERKEKNIQMNTMGDMYDSDRIIDDISIVINDVYPNSISDVRIDPIINPQDYSVLSLVNKFQNEKMLLDDLERIILSDINSNGEVSNIFKENILNVKSMINDGDIINRLLEDDIETYNSLLERINGCTTRLHRMKKSIKLIFRIYKSLLNNYNIYEQAIVKYTDLALESVFNIGNSYEIC